MPPKPMVMHSTNWYDELDSAPYSASMAPVQQHHGQQRGQYHGVRHFAGLEGIDDQEHKGRKGHDDLRHGAFSLLGKLSVVYTLLTPGKRVSALTAPDAVRYDTGERR